MIETPVAPSLSGVMPSQIRELADVAFGMEGVLKLHFGESNMPTPDYIKQAASQALADGYTYYSENGGIPPLRAKIAEKTAALHGVQLDPDAEIGRRRARRRLMWASAAPSTRGRRRLC